MRKTVSVIKKLLDECSDEDRGEWQSHTQTILSAVRSSHPTRRGVTNAIAAGFFESSAFPVLAQAGWMLSRSAPGSPTLAMSKGGRVVRVLIASLQQESGKPRRHSQGEAQEPRYIALLPRKTARTPLRPGGRTGRRLEHGPQAVVDRTFSLEDFDVLAVNLHAATRRWVDFRYTLAAWLVPRECRANLIANEQPVPLEPSRIWTSELLVCVRWLTTEIAEDAV
jgi:hypothetical protein